MKEANILGKYAIITGFRNVSLNDVNKFLGVVQERIKNSQVQFFDAKLIAGWEHIYFAALNALRAFETGLNISKSPSIEALLFASGQHQISKAVDLLGIKPRSSEIGVLIMADSKGEGDEALREISAILSGERCHDVLRLTEEKAEVIKRMFGISDQEIEAALREEGTEKRALTNLVIEHIALLATRR